MRTVKSDGVREEWFLCSSVGFSSKEQLFRASPIVFGRGWTERLEWVFIIHKCVSGMCISRKLFRVPNKCTFLHFYVEPDYFILKNDLVAFPGFPTEGCSCRTHSLWNFLGFPIAEPTILLFSIIRWIQKFRSCHTYSSNLRTCKEWCCQFCNVL